MITLLDSLAESDSCSARRSELEAAVLIERSERSLTAPTARRPQVRGRLLSSRMRVRGHLGHDPESSPQVQRRAQPLGVLPCSTSHAHAPHTRKSMPWPRMCTESGILCAGRCAHIRQTAGGPVAGFMSGCVAAEHHCMRPHAGLRSCR